MSVSLGLDRIDSDLGYQLGNIVPCCGVCNMMKNNLSYDEFFKKVYQIVENNNNNK